MEYYKYLYSLFRTQLCWLQVEACETRFHDHQGSVYRTEELRREREDGRNRRCSHGDAISWTRVARVRRQINTPNKSPQNLRSSFSSVWTATIARVGALFSILRDLQDLHSFSAGIFGLVFPGFFPFGIPKPLHRSDVKISAKTVYHLFSVILDLFE